VGAVVPGLRQRKKIKARRALGRSALRLFARKGFTATTVDEIAAAVDLSPRTFFRYFASKEDVVFASAEDDLEVLLGCLQALPGEVRGYEALEAAVVGLAREVERRPDEIRVRFRLVRANPLLQVTAREAAAQWSAALAAGLAGRERATGAVQGTVTPTPVEGLLASLAVSALWQALEAWGAGETDEPLEATVTALLRGCRAALMA
jgi:AcrR family transcriptional regulator